MSGEGRAPHQRGFYSDLLKSSVRPLQLFPCMTDVSSSLFTSSRSPPCQTMPGGGTGSSSKRLLLLLLHNDLFTITYLLIDTITSSHMYFFAPFAPVHHGHKVFLIIVKWNILARAIKPFTIDNSFSFVNISKWWWWSQLVVPASRNPPIESSHQIFVLQ